MVDVQSRSASDPLSRSGGLWQNILGAALFGCLIDGIIFAVSKPNATPTTTFPPDWLVGAVWVILFGLMGAARWFAGKSATSIAVTLLLMFCAAYPFYTQMFQSVGAALIGNCVTLAFALAVVIACWRRSRKVSYLVLPTVVWLLFAIYLTRTA